MAVSECARPAARRVPRRRVLLAVSGVVAVPALGAVLASCGSSEPDPLVALAARADADAALIGTALATVRAGEAAGSTPATDRAGAELAGRLASAAQARTAHAKVLRTELGDAAPPSGAATPSATPTPPGPADPKAALTGVLSALDDARQQAAELVPTLPRRRAALVGSVAACCAAYREVLG